MPWTTNTATVMAKDSEARMFGNFGVEWYIARSGSWNTEYEEVAIAIVEAYDIEGVHF